MSPSGCLSVVLNDRATAEDMLRAYFLCVVFWEKVRTILEASCVLLSVTGRACVVMMGKSLENRGLFLRVLSVSLGQGL